MSDQRHDSNRSSSAINKKHVVWQELSASNGPGGNHIAYECCLVCLLRCLLSLGLALLLYKGALDYLALCLLCSLLGTLLSFLEQCMSLDTVRDSANLCGATQERLVTEQGRIAHDACRISRSRLSVLTAPTVPIATVHASDIRGELPRVVMLNSVC